MPCSVYIFGAAVAIMVIGTVGYFSTRPPGAPPETYTVLHVCDAKLFHISRGDAIVKRDSDGQVFVRVGKSLEKADSKAKYKDLCP